MPSVDFEVLFDSSDPAVKAGKLELLKTALNDAPTFAPGRYNQWTPALPGLESTNGPESGASHLVKALADPELTKALGADVMASVQAQLDATPDLVKDLTLTSPLSTGYVAFDLEAPAKLLTPRPTPLRNRIPRGKGVGTAHRYKRITGHTGTGTGVGNLFPGITDATTTTFGSINYLRGPKISYAGDEASVPYLQYGLSDQVPWSNQFSAQGFQDMRQLSQTSLMYSSMLMEERMLLGSRGTASGFLGALSAPGTPVATVRAAVGTEVGNSANIASVVISVTAVTQFGETLVAQSVANTGMSAATGRVVDVSIPAAVAGAQAYKVYIGTAATLGTQFPAALTIGNTAAGVVGAGPVTTALSTPFGSLASTMTNLTNTFGVVTINFTGLGTGGLPTTGANPGAAASDSSALAYDGILPICQGVNSGYTTVLNNTFGANPGDEYNKAFAFMYDQNKADPDEVLFNGNDRKQLSDLIKLNSNSSSYRITVQNESTNGYKIGAVVNGLLNEVTGKMVDFTVHPWLFQGVSPILSWTLPLPDSQISDTWKVFNVQDYMAIQWPVTQFAYEASTYWYGTFLCYAAQWQGCISGIIKK